MRGDTQLHMRGADLLQAVLHYFERQVRFVAIAAQVAQVKVPQIVGHDVGSAIGGRLVREMTVPTQDSLLKTPRAMWAFLQHPDVMIGFKHEHVCRASSLAYKSSDMAKVGGDTNISTAGAKHEADGILGIMRHGKGFDGDVAHVKAAAAHKQTKIQIGFERAFDFVHCRPIAINRDVQLLRNADQPGDMVAVFVSDKNGGQIFRRASDARQAKANLAWTEAGIHQNACLVGFDVRSITGGTTTENREFDSHAETLTTVSKLDNAIHARGGLTIHLADVFSVYENHPGALPVCQQRLRPTIQRAGSHDQ